MQYGAPMNMSSARATALKGCLRFGMLGALGVLGCSEGDAPKAWSALSTCLVGKAANEPLVARAQQLRLIQLSSAQSGTSKDAWPGRCSGYADDLYAALPDSGQGMMLKRKLAKDLSCSEQKGSCKFNPEANLLNLATELWETAKDSGMPASETIAGVPVPQPGTAPVVTAATWKSFSAKPMKFAGPVSAGDGRALVLLKPEEGRARPTACEFTEAFSKVRCTEASPNVPELPAHSIEVIRDAGVFAAGMTETGLVAYDLRTGEQSAVRGQGRRLVRDGIAVEPAAKEDVSAAPPKKGAKPDVKEEGFIAVALENGKASREVKLPIVNGIGNPMSVGKHIVYLSQAADGTTLEAKTLDRGRLKPEATLKGAFSCNLRTCQKGDTVAVAALGSRSGLPGAKATGGAGKTQFTLALFRNGAWSKALEATLPFERAYDSELVCTDSGASLAYAQNADDAVQIGRIDCSMEACKSSEAKLAGVKSKWWWTVAPLGDQVLMLWRSNFGETRLRLAPLSELPQASDTLVFDSPDFGGPAASEPSSVISDDAALMIFRDEKPVALHIAKSTGVRVLAL
jgi:hypothetical protein